MNIGNSFAAAGFSRLAALAFALALPSLVSATTNSREESPQATSASVYADVIGSARFERSAIKVEQGYTVESGNLYTRDGDTGSLVVVRSPSGAITLLVDQAGKRRFLVMDTQGTSSITEEPFLDYLKSDTVAAVTQIPRAKDDVTSAVDPHFIDLLVAYNVGALREINADPIAYALVQIETVNLGLRNSLVSNLSLRLVAVNVFDVSYDTSSGGLHSWKSKLDDYRTLYHADVSAAFTSDTEHGVAGMAFVFGDTSVNWSLGFGAFRHEIGHNAGGGHCNDNPASYHFGYDNGKSSTYLCGNGSPYYSTPAVRDAHGLPLGNAQTADMARVWRENTVRMTGYKTELPGLRMLLVSPSGTQSEAFATLIIPAVGIHAGVVALSRDIGPTELTTASAARETMLTVPLYNAAGIEMPVKLRATRRRGNCTTAMNVGVSCSPYDKLDFDITYKSSDNPALPVGYYNGLLKLEAKSPDSNWSMPINIAISTRK